MVTIGTIFTIGTIGTIVPAFTIVSIVHGVRTNIYRGITLCPVCVGDSLKCALQRPYV